MTITVDNDDYDYGYGASVNHTASGGNYENLTATIDININGVFLKASPQKLSVQQGESASYTVVVGSALSANLPVQIESNSPRVATVSPSSLTFTPSNWNSPKTVTVTGISVAENVINMTYVIPGDEPEDSETLGVPVTVTAPPPAPSKPAGFTATAGDGKVVLRWDDPSDATITRWEYQQKTGGSFGTNWTTIDDSNDETTSHTVTGLTNGTAYTFRIRAVNATGNGAVSDEQTATPTAPTPAKPTGFTATAGNAQVVLRWSDPGNATITGWQVQRNEAGGAYGGWTNIPGSGASTTSYTVTSLTNGTLYGFKIRAVNPAGNGAVSDEQTATPALPAPAAPTGFGAAAGNTEATLSWDNPNNGSITGYKVLYAPTATRSSAPTWRAISSSGASTTSHTVTSLVNGRPTASRCGQ